MTKKLVFANLIGNDFNDFQFDTHKSLGSVELQQMYGIPRTDKVTTQLEYSLVERIKNDLNILKADLYRATIDPDFRKEFTKIADTKYSLRKHSKFSNGQKLIEKQCNEVQLTWLAVMIFEREWVYINYFSSINGIPILSHRLKISDIRKWMRQVKLTEIFID